jgi:hypothetical protein
MVEEIALLENQKISTEQEKLSLYINELVENLKINIRDILSLDNISQIKSFFEQL